MKAKVFSLDPSHRIVSISYIQHVINNVLDSRGYINLTHFPLQMFSELLNLVIVQTHEFLTPPRGSGRVLVSSWPG